jgi:hypothetical protein
VRVFFHRFIEFGSTFLYHKYVVALSTAEEASVHSHEYAQAGLPGCVGSSDATHIVLEKVEYRLRQSHLGFKSSHTARSYNITVNHRRQILASTTGHPARWNDKTVVLFDDFIVALNEGTTSLLISTCCSSCLTTLFFLLFFQWTSRYCAEWRRIRTLRYR